MTLAGTQNGPASQLLDAPPPLRLSPKPSAQPPDFELPSPSTDDEDHSSVFNPNSLASPLSAAVSKLVKPTAPKTGPSLGGNPSGSQVQPALLDLCGSKPAGCQRGNQHTQVIYPGRAFKSCCEDLTGVV